jgi:hypothetical protein
VGVAQIWDADSPGLQSEPERLRAPPKTETLYLSRCQVDTPDTLVTATWNHVSTLRSAIGKVVDFGAGDGRFAQHGQYERYVGYEIDADRARGAALPANAKIIRKCAFDSDIDDADLCIGNPPFVRNQDLPSNWRVKASEKILAKTGVKISGLANAWQYFFLLSLASTKHDGLCALVIPYEWVSRPSVQALRDFIGGKRWNVNVYRLVDETFDSVLTTSSITIVDKSKTDGSWRYFEETTSGEYNAVPSPSGTDAGVLRYAKRTEISRTGPRVMRGLSPGTQKVLTLTEGERVHFGLSTGRDVVPCVTTLRHLPADTKELNENTFRDHYRVAGQKCWLIRTDSERSKALTGYLGAVPTEQFQTATCLERDEWWKFNMPSVASLLMAMSFKGSFPKVVINRVGARAVGGVYCVHNVPEADVDRLVASLEQTDIRDRIVPHANGLRNDVTPVFHPVGTRVRG